MSGQPSIITRMKAKKNCSMWPIIPTVKAIEMIIRHDMGDFCQKILLVKCFLLF